MKNRYILIGTGSLAAILIIYLGVALVNNTSFLFALASGLDRPSRAYYAVVERIYYLAAKKDLQKKLFKTLNDEKDSSTVSLYLHVLGVMGANVPGGLLVRKYAKYQSDPNNRALLTEVVNCMGLSGKQEFVPFLEKLLIDYDKLDVQVTKYTIMRSLFLITGRRYAFGSDVGNGNKLTITKELEKAREIVTKSKGRRRTLEEMIVLDKLFRPPGW